jgi:hypothetical protein
VEDTRFDGRLYTCHQLCHGSIQHTVCNIPYYNAQEELVESVEDAGFDGRLLGAGAERGTARLHVDGMICSACTYAEPYAVSFRFSCCVRLMLRLNALACSAAARMACSRFIFRQVQLSCKAFDSI